MQEADLLHGDRVTLAAYASQLPKLRHAMQVCEAYPAFLSSLNTISRLALGKWQLRSDAIETVMGLVVLPGESKGDYYQRLVEASSRQTCLFVPTYMAQALQAKGFKIAKQATEYLMDPTQITDLPGGRLKRLRTYVRAVQPLVQIDHDVAVETCAQDLLTLNKAWYKEASVRLFRPSEKTNIDWLIQNWSDVRALDPRVRCTTVRLKDTGQLVVFQMGTQLCDGLSVTFCERYDRDLMPKAANLAGLGPHMTTLGEALVNDGPAGTADQRAVKERLSGEQTIVFYSVSRK